MIGQGLIPKRYDPLADLVESRTLTETLATMRETIASYAERLPLHSQFLHQIGMKLPEEDGP